MGKLVFQGKLAVGVAHEINKPVTIMAAEAGWLLDLVHEEEALFAQSPNY